MRVTPATWHRRIAAQTADLGLLAASLYLIAQLLPEGPPPADAMAFFTLQDFINYFALVAAAVLLVLATFQVVKVSFATPAQRLFRLRLTTLEGDIPTTKQVNARSRTALKNILLIMLPGPLIALFVGSVVAIILEVPFTTTDKVLVDLEIPQNIRYGIHALSFAALLAAVWYVALGPAIRYFERNSNGLTRLDAKTGTTHVRDDA